MQIEILTMEQRTEEWYKAKLGRISASEAEVLLVGGESKFGAGLESLINRKACELLLNEYDFDGFTSKEAQWGIDFEDYAREQFKSRNFITTKEIGFIKSREHLIGCSPDLALEDIEVGGEIKCFSSHNHFEIIQTGVIPKKVVAQIQYSLMVTGWEMWYLILCDPRMKKPLDYHQIKVQRDDDMIKLMRSKAVRASDRILEIVRRYDKGFKIC